MARTESDYSLQALLRWCFELHTGLLEQPSFNEYVMYPKQIQRAANVVLLTYPPCGLWP